MAPILLPYSVLSFPLPPSHSTETLTPVNVLSHPISIAVSDLKSLRSLRGRRKTYRSCALFSSKRLRVENQKFHYLKIPPAPKTRSYLAPQVPRIRFGRGSRRWIPKSENRRLTFAQLRVQLRMRFIMTRPMMGWEVLEFPAPGLGPRLRVRVEKPWLLKSWNMPSTSCKVRTQNGMPTS